MKLILKIILNRRVFYKGYLGRWEYHKHWPNPEYFLSGRATAPYYVFFIEDTLSVLDIKKPEEVKVEMVPKFLQGFVERVFGND